LGSGRGALSAAAGCSIAGAFSEAPKTRLSQPDTPDFSPMLAPSTVRAYRVFAKKGY